MSTSSSKTKKVTYNSLNSSGLKSTRQQDAIFQLINSVQDGELVAVVGSGVSAALTDNKSPCLSWKGLIRNGFDYANEKGKITDIQLDFWKPQIDSNDIDDLILAAEFVGRKLDGPKGDLYARWLESAFHNITPTNSSMKEAIQRIQSLGIPICTLNYDLLLEQVTGLPAITLNDTNKVTEWMRSKNATISPGVLHLHGSWDAPTTCVMGVRDYEGTLGNDIRDLIQRSLASFKQLLFIGCGDTFSDPNFSALIKWLKSTMSAATPVHYALVTDSSLSHRNADPTWQGFVEPISYGSNRNNLPTFLLKHFTVSRKLLAKNENPSSRTPNTQAEQLKIIQNYRSFLVKDCGQMTIEGMRAGIDIGNRRFELERLFVPLKVLSCEPVLSENDPERSKKLHQWKKKNKTPIPFGRVFSKYERIALLALPGGGKTILLKRLAVAYADPNRRLASDDSLPKNNLLPVMIRCREWREHIHRPIPTLLQRIPEITGQSSLSGLSDALIPQFTKGNVVLLVDGLDEIHDDALRATFVSNLEIFLDDYKKTKLVITSREAGFGLVAPSLSRFCSRWRIAPLEEAAISGLCDHWHRLMVGDSPAAKNEGITVAQQLLRNSSLRRLAENPLLLTMLLVVKHGAGRLPPDRVSLYDRAVEVLLDTWNIQGHESLSSKEAVPQLAYVAFQMMRSGKQTATEKELLELLEEAREKVPQIKRYAKDSPHEFLKRVELRSSLLVEAGNQVEGNGKNMINIVPFYQFRHLTFQEYLAAVAAVEGHYMEYDKSDTVLKPLAPYLTNEKWEEVIPMTAVLARKQAEPLLSTLVAEGEKLVIHVGKKDNDLPVMLQPLPSPVSLLVQSLVEEAEASPDTLTGALKLIARFARGCQSTDDWQTLVLGPYGEELQHHSWLLYNSYNSSYVSRRDALNTCQRLASLRRPKMYWTGGTGKLELQNMLASEKEEQIGGGLFICAGILGNADTRESEVALAKLSNEFQARLEELLFHESIAISIAALSALSISAFSNPPYFGVCQYFSSKCLDSIVELSLDDNDKLAKDWACIALYTQVGLRRDLWKPVLTESQIRQIMNIIDNAMYNITRYEAEDFNHAFAVTCSLVIAFHARNVLPDDELAKRLVKYRHEFSRFEFGPSSDTRKKAITSMLEEISPISSKKSKTKIPSSQGTRNNPRPNP